MFAGCYVRLKALRVPMVLVGLAALGGCTEMPTAIDPVEEVRPGSIPSMQAFEAGKTAPAAARPEARLDSLRRTTNPPPPVVPHKKILLRY